MDFIKDDIKALYQKYLAASLASALIMSIYSFVDTIAVGQSEGAAGAAATPLYGVLVFLGILCGVGQAIQPIVSANCGVNQPERIHKVWNMALATVLAMGAAFTCLGELLPTQIIRLFVAELPEVLQAAPGVLRPFLLLFVPLGVTVLSTYYLQSAMKGKAAMVIAILRSAVVSGLLLFLLPLRFGIQGVWAAMSVSELLVAAAALTYISISGLNRTRENIRPTSQMAKNLPCAFQRKK